jgi:tetratricopeptide (TPR) repeat protein
MAIFRVILLSAMVSSAALAQQAPNNLATMAAIATGLGVKCDYCHARGRAMRGPVQADPSGKPSHMEIARQMMAMTGDLNAKIQAITGKPPDVATRVSCVTCHRGVAIPGQLSDILINSDRLNGPAAAIEKYRMLRTQYFGRQSYDFGEETLIAVGTALANTNPEDAVALLQLNLEFFPKSVNTYQQIAYAYTRNIDDADAIGALEKALEIDPENGIIKGRLEQLRSFRRKPK